MTSLTRELTATLTTLEALLRRHQVSYAHVIGRTLEQATIQDEAGVKRLVRSLFIGTVGSLTDLIISRQNGDAVEDERAANAALEEIVTRLWQLSK